jgi:hypothetical protein
MNQGDVPVAVDLLRDSTRYRCLSFILTDQRCTEPAKYVVHKPKVDPPLPGPEKSYLCSRCLQRWFPDLFDQVADVLSQDRML